HGRRPNAGRLPCVDLLAQRHRAFELGGIGGINVGNNYRVLRWPIASWSWNLKKRAAFNTGSRRNESFGPDDVGCRDRHRHFALFGLMRSKKSLDVYLSHIIKV